MPVVAELCRRRPDVRLRELAGRRVPRSGPAFASDRLRRASDLGHKEACDEMRVVNSVFVAHVGPTCAGEVDLGPSLRHKGYGWHARSATKIKNGEHKTVTCGACRPDVRFRELAGRRVPRSGRPRPQRSTEHDQCEKMWSYVAHVARPP